MPLVRPRLGENFNAAIAELVIFRRKRILVDANFANRSFGRERATGEAVNIYLASVGSGRRASQRLQVRLQFIGVIGERFEVFSPKDDHTVIILYFDVYVLRRIIILYLLFLFFDRY